MAGDTGPEAMRSAMAEYVAAVHRAYLEASAALPPAERARLPLAASGTFTVAAVGTRYLHVVATTDALPAPAGQEISLDGREQDLSWSLRFFDPVVLPPLGLLDETEGPQSQRVRDLLGITGVVYHLTVPPGGGLTTHHALHAGTGLAHSHAAAARDYESLLALLPHRAALVSQMHAAETSGLPSCVVLLARHLAPVDDVLLGLDPDAPDQTPTMAADARRRLLAVMRERG